MNYLVQMKLTDRPSAPQEGLNFIEQMIRPTLELCKKLEAQKRIVAGGPLTAATGLSMVISAESAQGLHNLISSLPAWPEIEASVTSLTTFEVRAEAVRALLEQIKIQGGSR